MSGNRWWPYAWGLVLSVASVGGDLPALRRPANEERVFTADSKGTHLAEGISSPVGFALDFEVRFDGLDGEHRIFHQEGLLLLRMDPPSEGGALSFFVDIDGQLEPRLRTVPVEVMRWYRVTASWDGQRMWMRVDGKAFLSTRVGTPSALTNPLEIAPQGPNGAAGLRGRLRNVRIYNRPLTQVESILAEAKLPVMPGIGESANHFEFARGPQAWKGIGAEILPRNGTLVARPLAPTAVVATHAARLVWPGKHSCATAERCESRQPSHLPAVAGSPSHAG